MLTPNRLWRFFYCLITTLLITHALAITALAQGPAKVQISDTLYRADGTPASGSLLISWPAFMTADGKAVAAGSLTLNVENNGAVSLQLAPNAHAVPAGTYYKVVLKLDDGRTSTEYWSVPSAGPVTIGAIRTAIAPATVALGDSDVTREWVMAQDALRVAKVGDSMSGALTLSDDPTDPAQAVTKRYVDAADDGLQSQIASKAADTEVVHTTGDENITGAKNFKNLNTIRNAPQFASVQTALDDLPAAGGRVFVPTGTLDFSTTIDPGTKQNVDVVGAGLASILNFTGMGKAWNIGTSYQTISDLQLHCNSMSGDHCLHFTNTPTSQPRSNFNLYNLGITNAASQKAGLHIFSSQPANIYGFNLFAPQITNNLGHGFWLEQLGQASVSLVNVFGGAVSSNYMSGHDNIFADSSGGVNNAHGLNLIGVNLQGGGRHGLHCAGCHGLLLGSYFEQYSSNAPIRLGGATGTATGSGAFTAIGNSIGGVGATYCVDMTNSAPSYHSGLLFAANGLGGCQYAYNLNHAVAPVLGLGEGGFYSPSGPRTAVDWSTATQFLGAVVFDMGHEPGGTESQTAGYLTIAGDHTIHNSPKLGIGVLPAANSLGMFVQTAMLEIAGRKPVTAPNAVYASGNGTNADAGLIVHAIDGGNTTSAAGKTAGAGSSIALEAGNGGNAPAGSTNGNGGSITLAIGKTGTGAGSAGSNGKLSVKAGGVEVASISSTGVFTGDGSGLTGVARIGGDLSGVAGAPTVARINGTTVPVNTSANQALITTAAATGSWTSLPDCLDSAGNHLNYNAGTHAFTCGNTAGSVGSVAFSAVTGGTNTQAAMLVGSGASLAPAGSGTITATGLAATPAQCPSSQFAVGVAANGDANCGQVGYSQLSGTPTLGNVAALNAGSGLTSGSGNLNVNFGAIAGTAAEGNDMRITGAEQYIHKNAPNGYAGLGANAAVAVANGGTGATDAATARANLGALSATSVPLWLQYLGDGSEGAVSCTGMMRGEHWVSSFTVPAGQTCYNSNFGLIIRSTGACTINGLLAGGSWKGAADGPVAGWGAGFGGGGGGGSTAGTAGWFNTMDAYAGGGAGFVAFSAGNGGSAGGGNGGDGQTLPSAWQPYVLGNWRSLSGFDGTPGGSGGNSGASSVPGAAAIVLTCGSIVGTGGVIDASGWPGNPSPGDNKGASAGGGGAVVILAAHSITDAPAIALNGGQGGGCTVPQALVHGAGGNGARLSLTVSGGAITGCSVDAGGSGYLVAPRAVVKSNSGSGAQLTLAISGGIVDGCTVNNGGSGYVAATYSTCGAGGKGADGWSKTFTY